MRQMRVGMTVLFIGLAVTHSAVAQGCHATDLRDYAPRNDAENRFLMDVKRRTDLLVESLSTKNLDETAAKLWETVQALESNRQAALTPLGFRLKGQALSIVGRIAGLRGRFVDAADLLGQATESMQCSIAVPTPFDYSILSEIAGILTLHLFARFGAEIESSSQWMRIPFARASLSNAFSPIGPLSYLDFWKIVQVDAGLVRAALGETSFAYRQIAFAIIVGNPASVIFPDLQHEHMALISSDGLPQVATAQRMAGQLVATTDKLLRNRKGPVPFNDPAIQTISPSLLSAISNFIGTNLILGFHAQQTKQPDWALATADALLSVYEAYSAGTLSPTTPPPPAAIPPKTDRIDSGTVAVTLGLRLNALLALGRMEAARKEAELLRATGNPAFAAAIAPFLEILREYQGAAQGGDDDRIAELERRLHDEKGPASLEMRDRIEVSLSALMRMANLPETAARALSMAETAHQRVRLAKAPRPDEIALSLARDPLMLRTDLLSVMAVAHALLGNFHWAERRAQEALDAARSALHPPPSLMKALIERVEEIRQMARGERNLLVGAAVLSRLHGRASDHGIEIILGSSQKLSNTDPGGLRSILEGTERGRLISQLLKLNQKLADPSDKDAQENAAVLLEESAKLLSQLEPNAGPYLLVLRYQAALAAIMKRQDQQARMILNRAVPLRKQIAAAAAGGRSLRARAQEVGTILEGLVLQQSMAGSSAELEDIVADAFLIAQTSRQTGSAEAVAIAARRLAASDPALRSLNDRLEKEEETLQRLVEKARQSLAVTRSADLSDQIAASERVIADTRAQIAKKFPEFQARFLAAPITLRDVRALLRPDEGLVLLHADGTNQPVGFAVSKNGAIMFHAAAPTKNVREWVESIRTSTVSRDRATSYPTGAAAALYQRLFDPAVRFLGPINEIIVVTDGALEFMPLGILVTDPLSPSAIAATPADLRRVGWLIDRFAIATLPSAATLRSARNLEPSHAPEPFLGIGFPLPVPLKTGRIVRPPRDDPDVIDLDQLRGLKLLVGARAELEGMAEAVGITEDARKRAILMGADANERKVRDVLSSSRHRIIHFATHGLIPQDLSGLKEPALLLTLPSEAKTADDGLFTASEIAQIKLDADLVILSTCNSAAPDGRLGSESLSGLGKAFLQAGARNLLASHWYIDDTAAAALLQHFGQQLAKGDGASVAELHRQAVRDFRNDPDYRALAHPYFWGAYSVVGARGRASGLTRAEAPR